VTDADSARVLESLQAGVMERLAAKHRAREAGLEASRRAIRASANAIRAAHRGDVGTARDLIGQAAAALDDAGAAVRDHPEVEHAGFISDARKEYAEASTTLALLNGDRLPGPDELGVGDAAYLNGLAETIGELRRHLLDQLRAGHLERSEQLLGVMDDIYAVLVTIDFPEGVTSGLRRSTDVARSIIERTRGDLTTALVQARLRDALEAHAGRVLGQMPG
jgi:translin